MDDIRIWFHPPQFWAATRNMTPEAVEELMHLVYDLAQTRQIEALRQFSFISIEDLNPRRKVG